MATTCIVTATKAASTGFSAITSAPQSFVFVMFNQDTLSIENNYTSGIKSTTYITLTTTGGSGTGAVTYSTSGPPCVITSGRLLYSPLATTCIVTATKAASTGFNAITSAPQSFVFVSLSQNTLTISNNILRNTPGSSITLTTTGGSGAGSVTYSVSGTGCSISGSTLKSEVATTCVVTATKAASTGYNATTSAPQSFVFVIFNQDALTISNNILRNTPGSSITLTTSGGSGTGAVTYSTSGAGCSISGSTISASSVTTCFVTATKAASAGYNAITSTSVSFIFALPDQPGLIPTFTTPTRDNGSFYVTITNYDSSYQWSASTTGGTVTVRSNIVKVTDLGDGEFATVTVRTNRAGFATGIGTFSSTAPPWTLTPSYWESISTQSGFRIQITNYDPLFTWRVTSSLGSAYVYSTGLLSVVGIPRNTRVTVIVTATRNGISTSVEWSGTSN